MGQSGFHRQKITSGKSKLSRRASTHNPAQRAAIAITLGATFALGVVVIIFFSGRLVVAGVPSSVILKFLNDDVARSAYFSGQSAKLHERLGEMGIEEEMKTFYRPQIPDEVELDQYIHQVLYDRTGYVGAAYRVTGGVLVLKK